MYSRNRKHFNISPLTYNGEGHVINLTLGHGLKNPRYTNCRVWWLHQILKGESDQQQTVAVAQSQNISEVGSRDLT